MRNSLKIKLDAGAVLPRKAHASDIGYDLSVMSAELEFLVRKKNVEPLCPQVLGGMICPSTIDVTATMLKRLARKFIVGSNKKAVVLSQSEVELVKIPLQEFLEKGYEAVPVQGGELQPRPRRLIVDTGVHVEPPAGYWVEVAANSRVVKLGLSMANCVGIIDPDYRGSIKIFFTITDAFPIAENLQKLLPGNVCGQMILRRAYEADVLQVDELSDTVRGSGGFGSTAK